ncbi:hypothetical protein H2248_010314 [Termitomyces sp. 'cryptogamus']|nr:hypothetical protein H2248_010314 [Termitomyces sp. 'cryptogamus']
MAAYYERRLAELDDHQQSMVRKLREAAGIKSKPKDITANAKDGKQSQAPIFTKKEVATLDQCIKILDWYHANGKNQSEMAKHFAPLYLNLVIKQPPISFWVKEEAK